MVFSDLQYTYLTLTLPEGLRQAILFRTYTLQYLRYQNDHS